MDSVASFLYEIGMLKRLPRAGWLMAGVAAPESVADHCFRTSILGYVLAGLAKADAPRTAMMCLLHDLHEVRVGDLHAMAKHYLDGAAAESAASRDQTAALPDAVAASIRELLAELHEGQTLESRLAHDADRLECLIQAIEYQSQGNTNLADWVDSSQRALQTDAAKQLAAECLRIAPSEWWKK